MSLKRTRRKNERVCYLAAEARLESVYKTLQRARKSCLAHNPSGNRKTGRKLSPDTNLCERKSTGRGTKCQSCGMDARKAFQNPLLLECLHEWLDAKGLPPLHFLVEPDTLSRLYDRRIFAATRGEEIVGFVLLSPVATRNGWLFEQFIHRPIAPNGTVELMIDAAMRALAEDGCDYATLGLSPLSVRARIEPFDNPLWLRILLTWMRKHAQRFYNFDGLDAFKAKLQPERWEPVFAIYNRPRISPRMIYAIASVFSGNRPIRLVLGGLWRAVLTEIKWLGQKFNRKSDK